MQTIKKAVIPAAGLGTRLHTLTEGRSKEMLSIGGRPMIYYTVQEAARSGLEHLYIVINKNKPSLQQYLESEKLEADLQGEGKGNSVSIPRITCIDQPAPFGSGDAIYRTKAMIGKEPFALMMPDFLLFGSSPALSQMIPSYERFSKDIVGALILGLTEAKGFGNVGIFQPTPLEEDIVEVHGISEKLKTPLMLKNGEKIHKAIGRCIFGSHFFSYLERVRPLEGEWDDAPAFRALCKERKVIGKILKGTGFDVGNPTGYRAAKEKFGPYLPSA
ncbi:MAG: sugar phosphate nucleotidyltransferase [Desulfobacteraceae bacterium]|jgi:UTP--glucose-1-phosphate uridylyltransferase